MAPSLPEAYSSLGVALTFQGRFAETIQQFRRALDLRPTFLAARENVALAESALGR